VCRGGVIRIKVYCFLLLSFLLVVPSYLYALDGSFIEVTVVRNDNLIRICREYLDDPLQWREIARVNGLKDPHFILPGQTLMFPVDLLKGIPIEGKVTFIKGDVSYREKDDDIWSSLNLDDSVIQGSGIKTGEESSVEITFEDGASFLMRSDTTLTISKAVKKGTSQIIRELFLKAGKIISNIKKATGSDPRFKIQTPSAIAAARGTEFRVSSDAQKTTRSEVLKGVVEVEAMKKEVMVKEGEGTLVRKDEPPVKPKKLLPPPAPVDLQLLYRVMPLKFRFEKIKDALSYRVMLARDSGFKDLVKDKVIGPDQLLEIVGVNDGMYYLTSLSIDKDGLEGTPSDTVEVNVRVNPLPPFIQSPAHKAELREKSVNFRWLNVADAEKYHLQIAEDAEFKRLIADRDTVRDTEYKFDFPDFMSYFFRVSSLADDGYEGVWSDIQSFTIVPPPPAPPVEKPEMGDKEIHMRWRDLGKGIVYHFQMARDAEFKDMMMDSKLEKPEITIQKPEKRGTYYVRTSGIDSEGYEGDFSLPQSFEVAKCPKLLAGFLSFVALFVLLVP